ncbi:MAG: response regulator transcription factor [Eubacteriales bacterium]|nr:response regulator transcription factor [Eubacteriales bacterium]
MCGKRKLLIADDEPGIIQLLKDYFEMQEYQIIEAKNGPEVLDRLSQKPDLILLDVGMPFLDGFEVCERIRSHVSCPILFLTARIEEADRIRGFMAGGDDYILKPFSIDELGARVAAHLRREERKKTDGAVKIFDHLAIHYEEKCVYYKGCPIPFTGTEYKIVEWLSLNPGQVFSKDHLYEKVRGYDGSADSSIMMEHIRRIRSKIKKHTDRVFIETVWGVGYKWIG